MKALLSKAEIEPGYPSTEFEDWYQQGMSFYLANLPDWLKNQAFFHLVEKWQKKDHEIEMWYIRAVVFGTRGFDYQGQRIKYVSESFTWPNAPDAGWRFMVLCYPDGLCDFDYGHSVTRKFWSEDNDFLPMPPDPMGIFNSNWFEKMGFSVMSMNPTMQVTDCIAKNIHLQLV